MLPFSVQFAANTLAELDAHVLEYAGRIPRPSAGAGDHECSLAHEGPTVWDIGECIRTTGFEVANQVSFLHNFVDEVVAHGWAVEGQELPAVRAQSLPTPADIATISERAIAAYSDEDESEGEGEGEGEILPWSTAQCESFVQKLGELLQRRQAGT